MVRNLQRLLKFPQDGLVNGARSGWRRERTRQVQHREFAAPSRSISIERRVRAAGGLPFAHVANQVPAGQ